MSTGSNGKQGNGEPESPIKFPCDFIIKVMGKAHSEFEFIAINIVKKHFPDFDTTAISKRNSKYNTYISLTITVHAESKQQLDELYKDLSAQPEILMAL